MLSFPVVLNSRQRLGNASSKPGLVSRGDAEDERNARGQGWWTSLSGSSFRVRVEGLRETPAGNGLRGWWPYHMRWTGSQFEECE